MVNSKQNSLPDKKDEHVLEDTRFPDLNLKLWKEWGFGLTAVIKPVRYHIIFQREKPILSYLLNKPSHFTLTGRLIRLNESMEKKLSKLIWPVYFAGLLFIGGMISGASAQRWEISATMFLLAWMILEGAIPIGLKAVSEEQKFMSARIEWNRIDKIILFGRSGVILLSFKTGDNESMGFSFGLKPDKAKMIYEKILTELSEMPQNQIYDTETYTIPKKNP